MVWLSGARVVVTGGCGLIGSQIGRRLREAGAYAVALDRLDAYPFDYASRFGARELYHDVVHGDVADSTVVDRVCAGADYVIHAAAYADVAACTTNSAESTRSNVLGTQRVLESVARHRPRRFVFVSSASVYGHGPVQGRLQQWNEQTPTYPISVYANAKLWGEYQTRLTLDRADVEYTMLRYFSVYGEPQVPKPGSHSWCVAWFGFNARLGRPLRLHGGGVQVRDFVHVDDVATATVLSLVAPDAPGRIVNVGTGVGTTVGEVADLVRQELPGARTVVTPGPADDPLGGYAETTMMEKVLGWRPEIGLADGVRRYLDWLRGSDVISEVTI